MNVAFLEEYQFQTMIEVQYSAGPSSEQRIARGGESYCWDSEIIITSSELEYNRTS
jgi:hypothetical protein